MLCVKIKTANTRYMNLLGVKNK